MRKILALLLSFIMVLTIFAGCGDASKPNPTGGTKEVELKFNLAFGNKSRTMTYNQNSPLTLSDGSIVSQGMLKPTWQYISDKLNSKFIDVAVQDIKASDMIKTESTSNFSGASIYGGEGVGEALMSYGAEGKFVSLTEMMEKGNMPNYKAYLDANPNVSKAITSYDGKIYYVPYVAEIGNLARTNVIRETWVKLLLDNAAAKFDTKSFETHYDGFYLGDNARTGDNGGSVIPKKGVTITKKTPKNIIEIQNKLPVKNGATLSKAFIDYIKENYDYANPSELFLGEKAAYDIDELVALFRCIKANPTYLTNGKADVVWPFFSRHSKYREDLLRYASYFDGVKVHGTDSYNSRWLIDDNGELQYTYSQENFYDVLTYLSDMNAEGLFYSDMFDLTVKNNFRSMLWGTDKATENPSFGFMTFDWIASSTNASLNPDTTVILPPVAEINGEWQYYIDNTRAIKPDGWAISVAGSNEEQIKKACEVMDFYFTNEGKQTQNYGLPMDISTTEKYVGPNGVEYPKFNSWVLDTCKEKAKGDLSAFFRDWMGSLMPIGYQKEIGFEYQNTSERGFECWKLLSNSTVAFPSYSGEGVKGINKNYYQLVPTIFSLTERQNETIQNETKIKSPDLDEFVFNVIRYKTLQNAPQGAKVANTYDEYLKYFKDSGLDIYLSTYQKAFKTMNKK